MKKIILLTLLAVLPFTLSAETVAKEVITWKIETKKIKRGSRDVRVFVKVPVERRVVIEQITEEGEVESTIEYTLPTDNIKEEVVTKDEAEKVEEDKPEEKVVKPKNEEAIKKLVEKIEKAKEEGTEESIEDLEEAFENGFGISEDFGIDESDFEIQ
jgi:hypothetical protein